MICSMCGAAHWLPIFNYDQPDKYEKLVGINDVSRGWFRCSRCRHYQSYRNYEFEKLEKIYISGYRDKDFRKESVEEAYNRISSIPIGSQENNYRVSWFFNTARPGYSGSLLDVGSGLGVWPSRLNALGLKVECVDVNSDSIDFIENRLDLPCFPMLPDRQYDFVSCIHTLEHMQDPESFLNDLILRLYGDGTLYLEIPDAIEFEYLDQSHDEFNSCHVHFFDVSNITRLVEFCGLRVTDIHRTHKGPRNLSRIMLLAKGE